jgi:hypothetical protein
VHAILLSMVLAGSSCALSSPDSAWIAASLEGWQRVSAGTARTTAAGLPELILFDRSCTFRLVPLRGSGRAQLVVARQRFAVTTEAHGDSITLPDGKHTAAGLTSFASPLPNGRMFFVMSLPSIWLANKRSDTLATAVFMHEFTHTQTRGLASRIDLLVKRGLPEDADDDVIQTRFSENAAFKSAYEAERDTLYAAVSAPSPAEARRLATSALKMMDRRRAAHFAGADSVFADAEDVFLSLEGTGQWMAYAWLVDPRGAAMPPATALPYMRRGGRRWSQDEGLALLLLVSRLSPAAPSRLFATRPTTIIPLLRSLLATPTPVR